MQRIYSGKQVKILDQEFLASSGISSHELMELAAKKFESWFLSQKFSKKSKILIVVGPGNNGGDGYAIARLLVQEAYQISLVEMFDSANILTPDAQLNKNLLPEQISIVNWRTASLNSADLLIDCFLGVGLEGILRKDAVEKITWINQFKGEVISVDLPSGLPSSEGEVVTAVKASITVTFQFPKLALFVPEWAGFTGDFVVLPLGINHSERMELNSNQFFLQSEDIKPLHLHFNRFSFKGDFGKILLVGSSPGKVGAVVLACKSALRTGAGLVSALVDDSAIPILQTSIPEAMCVIPGLVDFSGFDAIGIGPGWGLSNRLDLFVQLLKSVQKPIVLDADALNLLGNHPELISLIPKNSILTPHIGEFRRLVGPTSGFYERIETAKNFAVENELIIILKGPNTLIALPDGRQVFNSTGTQFMATGGSGDVLTGMITAYLGMGYSSENAALCGVYHHGLAGELAGKVKRRGLIASDIIEAIPKTYEELSIF